MMTPGVDSSDRLECHWNARALRRPPVRPSVCPSVSPSSAGRLSYFLAPMRVRPFAAVCCIPLHAYVRSPQFIYSRHCLRVGSTLENDLFHFTVTVGDTGDIRDTRAAVNAPRP